MNYNKNQQEDLHLLFFTIIDIGEEKQQIVCLISGAPPRTIEETF